MRLIEHLQHADDLERLVPAWHDLLRRAPQASPFQTPEWLLEWWRAFGGGRLHVLVERSGGELHGVAPFFVRPETDGHPPALLLVGTGNSDCLDLVADPDCDADALVSAALEDARRHGWDCEWRRVPPLSALLSTASDATARLQTDVPCPERILPRTDDELEASLGGAFRRKLHAARRRADRLGSVRFETARGTAVQTCLDDLFRLHAERWEARAMRGVLAEPVVQRFHRAVAARLDRTGQLRLVRMRIGGEAAAVFYGFRAGPRACFYIGGFNPAFAAVSPGTQIIREIVRAAIDEGAAVFDFLAGQEAYRYAWGAVDRPFFARLVAHDPGTGAP